MWRTDLQMYEIASDSWISVVAQSGTIPAPRSEFGMAGVAGKVYIFAGRGKCSAVCVALCIGQVNLFRLHRSQYHLPGGSARVRHGCWHVEGAASWVSAPPIGHGADSGGRPSLGIGRFFW